jgi:hypothetical protein
MWFRKVVKEAVPASRACTADLVLGSSKDGVTVNLPAACTRPLEIAEESHQARILPPEYAWARISHLTARLDPGCR